MGPSPLDSARQVFVTPIHVLPSPGRLPGLRKRLNAKVSGRVFVDFASSEQNQGVETGMQSVKLELLNASGALIAQTLTDQGGYYCFDQFSATGCYTIRLSGSSWLKSSCRDQHVELRHGEQVFSGIDFGVKLQREIKHDLC